MSQTITRQQMINHLLERGIFGEDFLNTLSDTLLREHYNYDIRLLERIGVATESPQFISERYMKMAGVNNKNRSLLQEFTPHKPAPGEETPPYKPAQISSETVAGVRAKLKNFVLGKGDSEVGSIDDLDNQQVSALWNDIKSAVQRAKSGSGSDAKRKSRAAQSRLKSL